MKMKNLAGPVKSKLRECRNHLHDAMDHLSEVLTRPDDDETPGRMTFVGSDILAAMAELTEALRYYGEDKAGI